MKTYKKDEGMWARVPAAVVGGVVTYFATEWALSWSGGSLRFVLAGIVFAVLAVVTLYFVFFHQKTGDVLIDTENEMRKVVWPTREEVAGSTLVVIATVFILGVTIYVMDIVLTRGLDLIGVY
ncbi:MAG: preprotein translocase subunit SecE [Planctomycetota bacterium]